jgi:cytochrome c556
MIAAVGAGRDKGEGTMLKSMKWTMIGAGAAAVLIGGMAGGIAQDKMAEIKARQDFMEAQGKDIGKIAAWGKGKASKDDALKAVDDLLARAPRIHMQFPAGTSAADFPGKTKAKADLWKNLDKVPTIVASVKAEEEKLRGTIEKGDAQAAAKQASALYRGNCNSCHNSYRLSSRS